MALFEWLTTLQSLEQGSALAEGIASLGLEVDATASSAAQLFACDPVQAPLRHTARVTVLAAWTNQSTGEAKIEVRTAEPMLRSGTRCEITAKALKQLFPARQAA